jgi:hypothetical protein
MSDDPTAAVLQATMMYLLMPLWLLAGFGDWCCHRAQRIEHSAGLKEALLHLLMLAEIGIGLLAALLLEVNAAVLALLLASCISHEITTWWDLHYASTRREIPVPEQWVHSLQLVLPWVGLVGIGLLHWPQALAAIGMGETRAEWQLTWKREPLPATYLMFISAAALLLVALPFGEEAWRCWRARRNAHPALPASR